MKLKEILERALKTFIQGFLGVLIATTFTAQNITDKTFWLSLLIAGIASGLSALMNSLQAYLKTLKGE